MKKILIIEDETNIRETLSDLLNLLGYDVLEAENGKEGIRLAQEDTVDLILCDVNMPEMDGYEVLKALRKTDRLTLVPFIFLTAKSSMEELRTGMELGADDYLTKPFTHDTLVKAIRVAEEKKLSLLDKLNAMQNQLNVGKLQLEDVSRINSHEIRRKLSLIQSVLPLIKAGDVPLEKGLALLEESGEEMDRSIKELNDIVNGSESHNQNSMVKSEKIETIWIIDDDHAQNMLTKVLLRKANPDWSIRDFTDPNSALEKIQEGRPDLIFLDINMPYINGFDFLERISEMELDLHVIMLSSSVSPSDIKKSLSYRYVANYVIKPLKKEKILEILTV